MRVLRGSALAQSSPLILAGAVSALGFAPLDLWPLSFLALAVLAERIAAAQNLRCALARGWWFGFGQFLLGLNWIATAFTYQDKMPPWIGWGAVILLSAYLGLFPALAGALAWRLARQHAVAFAFVFAAAWMLGEWLRAVLFTGFAWNPIAVVWLGLPWIAQTSQWVGTYGLSAFAVLIASLLGLGAWRQRRAAVAIAVATVLALATLGRATLAREGPPISSGVHIRVVQPNIAQDQKYDPAEAERYTSLYARLSGAPTSTPRILLWPEAATLRFLEWEPDARSELAHLLGPRDLLLLGGESVIRDPRTAVETYHNSVFALDSSGELIWRYDKAHLVPFGEYLPERGLLGPLGLARLVPGDEDFARGPGPRAFALPGFRVSGHPATVGVQICYEIIFSGHVIDEHHRPSFLFNPSNDAWFGAWGPPQHLAQARLRAIEEGVPIIRATPNGISALIAPNGALLAIVPRHLAGVIDAEVPVAFPPTVFARLGLWSSALVGICFGLIAAIFAPRASRI